jgi:hypothetical protein
MINCTRVSKNSRRGRGIEATHVRHRQPHHDRGQQPSVLAGDVASGRNGDHAGKLGGRAEHLTEPEFAQQQPQQCDADDRPGQADPDSDQELAHLIGQPLMGPRQHRAEHNRPEDAADRVDQRSLPGQHALQPFGGPDEAQQRSDHGRSRHDQDRPGHQCGPAGHAQQQSREHRAKRPGHRDSEGDQPGHHAAGVPAQLPQIQPQAGVVQDDRHRQRHQRLEGRAQQQLRVDIRGERPGDEAGRQQDDDRRHSQPAGKDLRTHR